jgi:ADP-ribose pyrophosphatase
MKNPFRRIASRTPFESPYFRVREDTVIRPNGTESPFAVIEMKRGASVLAITDDREVYLVREFKYAIDRPSLEVISGGLEPDEAPLDGARRELAEEAGLSAREWVECGFIDPFTTMVSGPVYLYIAAGLAPVARHPDEGEVLETVKIPLVRALEMIKTGEITHAPTCVLLYRCRDWVGVARAA